MNKLLKRGKISSFKDQGFITLEIIISLVIALLFVAVSMQSLVYAMAMKVQAQEKQRANELIQEDIERINRLGNTLGTEPVITTCNPVDTTTPTKTAYENSYAKALWDARGFDPTTPPTKNLIKKVKSDGSVDRDGKQLALRLFHISDTTSTFPHRTLKVGYQVWNWNGTSYTDKNGGTRGTGDEPIAETYVEIIPDVALQCP
jgi:type II secretory pathway pseudopilin PulG